MITSPDEFRRLRYSDDPAEYHRAAWEAAPLEVWREVVARWPDLRVWVAHNKTVPMEILEVLAHDPDPHVRHMVAAKRKLSPELQRVLATDAEALVRGSLAHNPKAVEDVLARLRGDADEEVRAAASRPRRR